MIVHGHLAGVLSIAERNNARQITGIVNANGPERVVYLNEVLRTDVIDSFPFSSFDIFSHGATSISWHTAPVRVNTRGQRFSAVIAVNGYVLSCYKLMGIALRRGRLTRAGEKCCSGCQEAGGCSERMNVSHGNRNGYVIKEENTSHFKEKNAGSIDLWCFLTFLVCGWGLSEVAFSSSSHGMETVNYSNFSRK